MSPKAAVTAEPSGEAEAPQTLDELEAARDELAALEEEQSSIWARIAGATEDPEMLLSLRQRAGELPAFLFASQVKVLRLSVADLERREQEARDEMERLAGPWEEARQRLEEAKQGFAEANSAIAAARSTAYNVGQDLAERRRQLQLLLTRSYG